MIILNGFDDIGLLILRVLLGFIFFTHAIPKLKMPRAMAKSMNKPAAMIASLGTLEFVSGLALIFGVLTQFAALAVGLVMLGSLYYKIFVWKIPFVSMEKPGWELDLILLGAAIVVLFVGAGSLSVDVSLGFWP